MDYREITFYLDYQPVEAGLEVGLVGASVLLGFWHKPLGMNRVGFRRYYISIPFTELSERDEFKFVVFNSQTSEILQWEEGENRVLEKRQLVDNQLYYKFRGMRDYRAAGVAIPLFSLRREEGWGVGELTDIKQLADWCKSVGMSFIQILPINDTNATLSEQDSYPYNLISIYAINPIYLNLDIIFKQNRLDFPKKFEHKREKLDKFSALKYSEVYSFKIKVAKYVYDKTREKLFDSTGFRRFLKSNHWLRNYAVFCTLRDRFGSADFSLWGEFSRFSQSKVDEFAKSNPLEVGFYYFLQYHLFRQLGGVRRYLSRRGVYLKGDLPIGIGRWSVDLWQQPELFNTTQQAGAPPDYFSDDGQNWGFPTYNWAEMARTGYAWWRSRFAAMGELYDALRIDHILGFFRIWEVPMPLRSGLLGHFNPSLPLTKEEVREQTGIEIDHSNTIFCSEIGSLTDSDCLFLEDSYQSGCFNLRINAYKTLAYRSLTDEQRVAFDALYEDYFFSRHNDFWQEQAMEKLPQLLKETDMLVCGEDLGMIPHSVPLVMRKLDILSLEVLWMPKAFGQEFLNMAEVPYSSVVTTSTHDTSTLRAWWHEDKEKTQRFYSQWLNLKGRATKNLTEQIAKKVLTLTLASRAMLAILPMQDIFALSAKTSGRKPESERINDPSNPRHVWNWRMHLSLRELQGSRELNQRIEEIIKETNR